MLTLCVYIHIYMSLDNLTFVLCIDIVIPSIYIFINTFILSTERSILKHFEMNCKDCYQPYSLSDDDCCIGRGSARIWDLDAMYLTTITLVLLCVFMKF